MRLLLILDVPNNRVTRVIDFLFCEVEYFSDDQAYLFLSILFLMNLGEDNVERTLKDNIKLNFFPQI